MVLFLAVTHQRRARRRILIPHCCLLCWILLFVRVVASQSSIRGSHATNNDEDDEAASIPHTMDMEDMPFQDANEWSMNKFGNNNNHDHAPQRQLSLLAWRNKRNKTVGSFCLTDDQCGNDLTCTRRICTPSTEGCAGKAATALAQSFDQQTYLEQLLIDANVSKKDLRRLALRSHGNPTLFYQSPLVQRLFDLARTSPPPAVMQFQQAVSQCYGNVDADGNQVQDKYQRSGFAYYGLHFEFSALLDIAYSLFLVRDTNPSSATPTYGRFTVGAEAGFGAEISFLVGYLFSPALEDFEDNNMVADVDGGFGPHVGTAVVVGFRGKGSMWEFTLGAGIGGGGLGLGYSRTYLLQPAPLSNDIDDWVLGVPGASCTDTCQAIGRTCDRDQEISMSKVNSEHKVEHVAQRMRRTRPVCRGGTSYILDGGAYAPIIEEPSDACFAVANITSRCEATPPDRDGNGLSRLCCCGDSCPVTKAKALDWILGEPGQSCTFSCERNRRACENVNPQNDVNTEEEVRNVAFRLDVSCSSTVSQETAQSPLLDNVTNTCVSHSGSVVSDCESSSNFTQRFCCCGSICPTTNPEDILSN